jgi:replicative DNA helicase
MFDDDPDLVGKAELIVAKNRNGPVGTCELTWDARTTTFADGRYDFQ